MGSNKIGSILRNAGKTFGFKGRKVANHSVRKTGIGRLLDANLAERFVAQHAGMKSIESLNEYKCANTTQISHMSAILSNESASNSGAVDDAHEENIQISNSQTKSSKTTIQLFSGNAFSHASNCTFNVNIGSLSPPLKKGRLEVE